MTARTEAEIHTGESEHYLDNRLLDRFCLLRRDSELFPDTFQVLLLAAVGQEAEMADLHEPSR